MKMKIGAYFYPQTTNVNERKSQPYFNISRPTLSEYYLSKNASKLYPKHKSQRQYALKINDKILEDWDDCDTNAINAQMDFCVENLLDYLIFDTYVGRINRINVSHLTTPFAKAVEHIENKDIQLEYAIMFSMRGARSKIPIGVNELDENRNFDITEETCLDLVNYLGSYIKNKKYLKIDNKPYVSIMFTANFEWNDTTYVEKIRLFFDNVRIKVKKYFGTDIYLVAVFFNKISFNTLSKFNLDAVTQYAEIPDFENMNTKKIQDYRTESKRNIELISSLMKTKTLKIIPSVSIGWDASIRLSNVYKSSINEMLYPGIPIIENNLPIYFKEYLKKVISLVEKYKTDDNLYINIFAFNEVGESSSLLPYFDNGTIIQPYMDIVKNIKSKLKL
jgi:hypothetical protein